MISCKTSFPSLEMKNFHPILLLFTVPSCVTFFGPCQVSSLTVFYSVVFSQSMFGVKKRVFTNTQSVVFVSDTTINVCIVLNSYDCYIETFLSPSGNAQWVDEWENMEFLYKTDNWDLMSCHHQCDGPISIVRPLRCSFLIHFEIKDGLPLLLCQVWWLHHMAQGKESILCYKKKITK